MISSRSLSGWLAGALRRLAGGLKACFGERDLGRRGESVALQRLRALGAELLGQRVRTLEGELDLVLRLDGRLLCVEVKSSHWIGAGARFRPGNRFSPAQERRQVRAAQALARRWTPGREPRRLLAELWFDEQGRLVQERWHELELRPEKGRKGRPFKL